MRKMFAMIAAVLRAIRTEVTWVFERGKWAMKAVAAIVAAPFGGGGPDALPEPPAGVGPEESVEDKVRRLTPPSLAEVILKYARALPSKRPLLPELEQLSPADKRLVLALTQDDVIRVIRGGATAAEEIASGKPRGESHADKLARLKARYASKVFSDGPELDEEPGLPVPAFR